jgi:Fic-DOC domain mobile mystery protein B
MGLNSDLVVGQTPLDPDEMDGLIVPTITQRKELDEFEQKNIEKASQWTLRIKISTDELLTESFIKLVHKKMYGNVWKWAGQFRKTNKNIGVEWPYVPVELKKLLDDCSWWIRHKTYPADEIAIRFKHRLVSIHCFPNGNGRHSRMMADLLAEKIFARSIFTWQGTRLDYIKAIKQADANDIVPLLKFARS